MEVSIKKEQVCILVTVNEQLIIFILIFMRFTNLINISAHIGPPSFCKIHLLRHCIQYARRSH